MDDLNFIPLIPRGQEPDWLIEINQESRRGIANEAFAKRLKEGATAEDIAEAIKQTEAAIIRQVDIQEFCDIIHNTVAPPKNPERDPGKRIINLLRYRKKISPPPIIEEEEEVLQVMLDELDI